MRQTKIAQFRGVCQGVSKTHSSQSVTLQPPVRRSAFSLCNTRLFAPPTSCDLISIARLCGHNFPKLRMFNARWRRRRRLGFGVISYLNTETSPLRYGTASHCFALILYNPCVCEARVLHANSVMYSGASIINVGRWMWRQPLPHCLR